MSSQLEFSHTLLVPNSNLVVRSCIPKKNLYYTILSMITSLFLYIYFVVSLIISTLSYKNANNYRDNLNDTLDCVAYQKVTRRQKMFKRHLNVLSIVSFQCVRMSGLFLLVTVIISVQLEQNGATHRLYIS